MAKDVVTFLSWCAEPEQDDRKRKGLKVLGVLLILTLGAWYYKRHVFSVVKSRQMKFVPPRK